MKLPIIIFMLFLLHYDSHRYHGRMKNKVAESLPWYGGKPSIPMKIEPQNGFLIKPGQPQTLPVIITPLADVFNLSIQLRAIDGLTLLSPVQLTFSERKVGVSIGFEATVQIYQGTGYLVEDMSLTTNGRRMSGTTMIEIRMDDGEHVTNRFDNIMRDKSGLVHKLQAQEAKGKNGKK